MNPAVNTLQPISKKSKKGDGKLFGGAVKCSCHQSGLNTELKRYCRVMLDMPHLMDSCSHVMAIFIDQKELLL